jgi:hypothetical protein
MISNELSTIQNNRSESARLAAAMDEFLSRGGQVIELQPTGNAPRPLWQIAASVLPVNPAPVKVRNRKESMQRLRIAPDIEQAKARAAKREITDEVRKVMELAKTMTQAQASQETGIHRSQLRKMRQMHQFEFVPPANMGLENLIPNRSDPVADARNVERIKAMRDIGVSRTQAARQMGVSTTLIRRLIKDHEIDYPLARPGTR